MADNLKKQLFAHIIFYSGLFSMMLGISVLISNYTGASRLPVFVSFSLMTIGILCAVFAIALDRRSLYLFFAVFFILNGLFFFLWAAGIIGLPITRCWPFLSIFTGISLIPAGVHKYKKPKAVFIVPGLAFLVLGCALLIFTFGLAPFSFKQFMLNWWHLLLLMAGLLLVLLSLNGKK
ncbi:MAG: hypothetical protein LBD20_09105 [Spirochaetaceae bacterium]|jgi:hypothetical protein|nr:hypothetical protein [Spirochaetaceae bacterium]